MEEVVLDFENMIDFIMDNLPEGSNLTREQVEAVLDLETKYMIEVGIAEVKE